MSGESQNTEPSSSSLRESAVDLMRRLPPQGAEANLDILKKLMPGHEKFLSASVDIPLKVQICEKTKKEYLCCLANMHENSFRSPWSNEYYPKLSRGAPPPPKINDAAKNMQVYANHAFNVYRHLYYQGGLSSAYVWNTDHGYGAAVLIKYTSDQPYSINGVWDSIHIAEMKKKPGQDSRIFNLSGNITRRCMSDIVIKDEKLHLVENLGRLIEEQESKLRSAIFEIYFGKVQDVVSKLKLSLSVSETQKQRDLQKSVINKIYLPGKGVSAETSEVKPLKPASAPKSPGDRRSPSAPLQLVSEFKAVTVSSSSTKSSPLSSPPPMPLLPIKLPVAPHTLSPTKKTSHSHSAHPPK